MSINNVLPPLNCSIGSCMAMPQRLLTVAVLAVSILATQAHAQAVRPDNLAALEPPPIPSDNPMSDAKTELGKMLFFDPKLSGNGAMPCSICHMPAAGWAVLTPVSFGYPGTTHWRNSQTIINSAYYSKLFWAGASKSLEGQARSAARGGVAGNGEDDMMEARLAFVPEYRERFNDVFGDDWPNIRHAYMAIAAFERTLVQTDTPFDNFMRGDDEALGEAEQRGMALFTGKAGCAQCHNGALFSDEQYHNLGVPAFSGWETNPLAQITFRFELYAKGSTEELYRHTKDDPGLYFRSKDKKHKGKFRTPSLRYTKYTFPYMHNGMLATLRDVVDFYNDGGGANDFDDTKSTLLKPLSLSESEKDDLVAFIESLSGEPILMDTPQIPAMEALGAPQ